MKWERALNGQAVRILHSVNQREYGGETIIVWNRKTGVWSSYFTTAGFFLEEQSSLKAQNDLTKGDRQPRRRHRVNGTMEICRTAACASRAICRTVVDGHEITYEESPGAEVRFK